VVKGVFPINLRGARYCDLHLKSHKDEKEDKKKTEENHRKNEKIGGGSAARTLSLLGVNVSPVFYS